MILLVQIMAVGLHLSAIVEFSFGLALMLIPHQVFAGSPVFVGARTLGSHGGVAARELGALLVTTAAADLLVA